MAHVNVPAEITEARAAEIVIQRAISGSTSGAA